MWRPSSGSSTRIEPCGIPILVGIWPFDSALNAEFMANEVPGVTVPDALVERMRRAERGGGRGRRRGDRAGTAAACSGMAARRAGLDPVGHGSIAALDVLA